MGRHIIQQEGSIDMASTSQSDTDMYDLYGVSNHYGNINGGHYTGKLEKWPSDHDINLFIT